MNPLTSDRAVRSIAAAGRLLVAFLLGIGVAAGPVLAQPAQPEKPKEDAKPEKLLHSVQLTADGKDEKLHSLDVRRADAAPASLEQLLAEAMKNNPDIRVAEAKLREAEAVLNQARLQATQKVATTYQLLQSQKARVEYAKKQYERFADLYKNRSIEKRILDERQEALAAAKAKLAEIEAELAYALGKPRLSTDVELRLNRLDVIQLNERALQGALDVTVPRREALLVFDVSAEPGTAVVLERSKPQPGSVVDKLRQALDKEVTVNFKNNPLENVLFNWGREFDIQFVMGVAKNPPVSLRLDKPLPLGAALQAVEDFVPTVKFVVRDYGILVAPWDRVPSGAVPLNVFWKASAVKDKKVAPVDKKP